MKREIVEFIVLFGLGSCRGNPFAALSRWTFIFFFFSFLIAKISDDNNVL